MTQLSQCSTIATQSSRKTRISPPKKRVRENSKTSCCKSWTSKRSPKKTPKTPHETKEMVTNAVTSMTPETVLDDSGKTTPVRAKKPPSSQVKKPRSRHKKKVTHLIAPTSQVNDLIPEQPLLQGNRTGRRDPVLLTRRRLRG
jgi:hypothetical protein